MKPVPIIPLLRGCVGGAVGGFIGAVACKFLAEQGLYAVAIPGGLVGLGFSLAARRGQLAFAVVSGFLGLMAGLLTQWQVYSNEPSFFKLVAELKDYHMATWIMLGIGTAIAFFLGLGGRSTPPARGTSRSDSNP